MLNAQAKEAAAAVKEVWECNVATALCVSGAAKNVLKEREWKSWREKRRSCGESRHLVESSSKQKQKHQKSNINCNYKLKSRQSACESRFMKTNLAQTLASVPEPEQTKHTIFKPEFFFVQLLFFTIFHPTSATGKPSTCCSRQLVSVCVCVCHKKVRLKSSS